MAFDFKSSLSFLKGAKSVNTDRSVGIDVGSSAIKVVELHQTEHALTLSTYGELQVGPYSNQPAGAAIKLDHEKSVEALVDVFRESGITADQSVFSVPLASSFLTTLSIQAETEEVAKRIPVEARKYIPIPLKEVALDWFEVGQSVDKESDETTHNILMAAIQNESLTHFQRQLTAVGKYGQPTEIEAFSAIRSIAKDDKTTAIILDLGASMSKLYIVRGATLQKIHRVKTGGEYLTKKLAELRSVSFGEAETLKRDFASDPANAKDVKTAMVASLERAFFEFKRVVQQYQHENDVTFGEIHLIGGGAQLDQISEYVAETFALKPVVFNPFTRVAYPAFMEDVLKELGSEFSVALGAALRPFVEE